MISKEEAELIPELKIYPNDMLEDCFYYKMAKAGRISGEHGEKAIKRLEGKENDPLYEGCMIVADAMIRNIDEYGVPCIAWME